MELIVNSMLRVGAWEIFLAEYCSGVLLGELLINKSLDWISLVCLLNHCPSSKLTYAEEFRAVT